MATGTLAAKQAARRARVIEAAMGLASEGGYDAVQMRDVASQAGVALGTLYRYFASKDQLLSAAMGEWIRQLHESVERRPMRGESAADRVVDVLGRANRSMERNPNLASALIRATTSPDREQQPANNVTATNGGGGSFGTMRGLLAGAIGERPDVTDIIHVLDLVWFALLVQWMSGRLPARVMTEELEKAARLLIR